MIMRSELGQKFDNEWDRYDGIPEVSRDQAELWFLRGAQAKHAVEKEILAAFTPPSGPFKRTVTEGE